MQTFLPYEDFERTAQVLDRQRLGKQRVETWQILRILVVETKGGSWRNHPAVLMWEGYEGCLAGYGLAICSEWIDRGYRDTMVPRFTAMQDAYDLPGERAPWLGDADLHLAYQSNLIRKDPQHYRPLFGNRVPDNLPYVWPVVAA